MSGVKKFISFVVAALMLLALLPAGAIAETPPSREVHSGSCGANLTWTLDTETGVLRISGSGKMTDYSPLTAPWYDYFLYIKALVIGSGVTSIGNFAFYWCTSLASVTIPDGVTSIGQGAFDFCSPLTSVTIPDGVTSIGSYAFEYCRALTTVTIPDSVTSIGDSAFDFCSSLTSVTIPAGVTSIGSNAFRGCGSLTAIDVASGNTVYSSIDGVLFNYDRTDLIRCPGGRAGSYAITDGVTSIGENAFSYCTSLTSVTIPDSVTSIGENAFSYCTSLTSVTIPDSVTSIGENAFSYCTSLTSVTIPDSVTSIGDEMFDGCSSLTSVTIPDSVTSIGFCAFYDCSSLTSVTIPDSVTSIGWGAFRGCSSLTSVTIPDSVTSIGESAFRGCTSLISATFLGAPPASFGIYAFYDCASGFTIYYTTQHASEWAPSHETMWNGYPIEPTSILFGVCGADGDNLTWTLDTGTGVLRISGSGKMYDYSSSSNVPWYDYRSYIKALVIGSGVTSIGERAFFECSNLISVTIPAGVTSIGERAFYKCTSLTSVTIPDSVTSIGGYVFRSCSALTSVTIPAGVTSIGYNAFCDCSALTEIDVSSGNPVYSSIDGVLFNYDRTDLIRCPGGRAGAYAIPDGVTSIGWDAFSDCSSLTSVTIPDSVTSIGSYAFRSCSALTSVTIPPGVTSIGNSVFYGCSALTSVTIPDSVTSIGNYAFRECTSLTSVTIGGGVTIIGDSAFYGCTSLTTVTIPDSVTSINGSAFYGCSSLTSATFLGAPPASFGSGVFNNCASGFTIYYTTQHASEWAPNGETNWLGYRIALIDEEPNPTPVEHAVTYSVTDISFVGKAIGAKDYYYLDVSEGSGMFSGHWLVDYPEDIVNIDNYSVSWSGGIQSQVAATWDDEEAWSDKPAFVCNAEYEGATSNAPVGEPGNWYNNIGMYLTSAGGFMGLQMGGHMVRVRVEYARQPYFSECRQDENGWYVEVPVIVLESTYTIWGEGQYWYAMHEDVSAVSGKIYAEPMEEPVTTTVTFEVGTVDNVSPGDTVSVPITITADGEYEANTLTMNVFYDPEQLTYIGFTSGEVWEALPIDAMKHCESAYAGNTGIGVLCPSNSFAATGTLVYLNYRVADDCREDQPLYVTVTNFTNDPDGVLITNIPLICVDGAINIADTVTVTYTGAYTGTETVEYGGDAVLPVLDAEGLHYTFTVDGEPWDGTNITEDVTVEVGMAIDEYTVIFYDPVGEAAISTQLVTYGMAAEAPDGAPEHYGYTFAGWDGDYGCIMGDTVIYAVYEPVLFSVIFTDGFECVISEQTVPYHSCAIPPELPDYEGWTFTGWDADYCNIEHDMIINATWSRNYYTVTFVGVYSGTVVVEHGHDCELPVYPSPSISYVFTVDGEPWDGTNITSDVTVTVTAAVTRLTVRFCDWDGTLLKEQVVNYNAAATAPEVPEREGYTFVGWDKSFDHVTCDMDITAVYAPVNPTGVPGDVNCDGVFSFNDISALSLFLIGIGELAEGVNADFNGDGQVNFKDLADMYIALIG